MDLALASLVPADLAAWFTTTSTVLVVIFLAELGDKTQLVCMTLAGRYRGWPVFFGASLAFVFLNILAVIFGAALAQWIPEKILISIVAALFAVFGIQSLRASGAPDDDEEATPKSGNSILITAFLMIFVAELGDKTQIAVAGFAGTAPPIPVWVGATLALTLSSALGVVAGRKLLQIIPLQLLHRVSGIFFLILAAMALTRLW